MTTTAQGNRKTLKRRALDTFGLWVVVYPTATAVIAVIGPALAHLALPLRTLITSLVVVTLVMNVTGPLARALQTMIASTWRARRPPLSDPTL